MVVSDISSYIPLMLKSNKSYHIILSPSWGSSWFYYELFVTFSSSVPCSRLG